MKSVQDQLIAFCPNKERYFNPSSKILEKIFRKKCFVTEKIPCETEVCDGVLWITTHGVQYPGKTGYLLKVKKSSVHEQFDDCLYKNDENNTYYIPSSVLPTMFNVHKSVVILDNCYSSEVAIDTLSSWKDNMIFTTGYIQDYYNSTETGLIKTIEAAAEVLERERGIDFLSYRVLKENKDLVCDVLKEINEKYKTQYNLF